MWTDPLGRFARTASTGALLVAFSTTEEGGTRQHPGFCSPLTGFTLVEYQRIAGDVIEQTIISASYHAIDPHVRGDSGTPPDQEERWGCP